MNDVLIAGISVGCTLGVMALEKVAVKQYRKYILRRDIMKKVMQEFRERKEMKYACIDFKD
jgi:hypothetical protein